MHLTERYGDLFMFVFAAAWFGGSIALYLRAFRLQMAYYARFPDEIQFRADRPYRTASFASFVATWRVMLDEQPDPTLESMRREIWRRMRLYALWMFAFPISVAVVVAILTSTGSVR